ncbi:hypothetical protein OIU78_013320 [Salix suchowensis]|nr:hypothetical protein OIU78_013320 [Salix suchowensis]
MLIREKEHLSNVGKELARLLFLFFVLLILTKIDTLAWLLFLCMAPSTDHLEFRKPIDQQPAIMRLASEKFLMGTNISGSSSIKGVARFESARKFSPVSNEGIGGFWWDVGVNHLKAKQDDLQKLDLSLKL